MANLTGLDLLFLPLPLLQWPSISAFVAQPQRHTLHHTVPATHSHVGHRCSCGDSQSFTSVPSKVPANTG